ncbi:MAG: RNA polymerase sigma factor [Wujia sp.]
MTDEEFLIAVQELQNGNQEGLRRIYDAYIKLIYAIVYDTLKNREDAEDITSEFFIKLVRISKSYERGRPHKAWLATIARNMAIDAVRKRNRAINESGFDSYEDTSNSIIEETIAQNESSTGSVENKAILAEDMRKAMNSLSDREREIVQMKLMGDMKFREISEALGEPMGTITWLYNQAIKKLRRCLANYE